MLLRILRNTFIFFFFIFIFFFFLANFITESVLGVECCSWDKTAYLHSKSSSTILYMFSWSRKNCNQRSPKVAGRSSEPLDICAVWCKTVECCFCQTKTHTNMQCHTTPPLLSHRNDILSTHWHTLKVLTCSQRKLSTFYADHIFWPLLSFLWSKTCFRTPFTHITHKCIGVHTGSPTLYKHLGKSTKTWTDKAR